MKKTPTYLIPLVVTLLFASCGGKNKIAAPEDDSAVVVEEVYSGDEGYGYASQSDTISYYDEIPTTVEEPYQSEAEDPAGQRYRDKCAQVYNADTHRLYDDGRILCYNYWRQPSGFDNKLYIYDSRTGRETTVSLNKTSLEDEAMAVNDIVERNGVLTIIMEENRNSNGWVEGTYVWQYNILTGSWKPLAKACSGAEFTDGGRAVKVNYAECLNPDEPTYLQKYRNHFQTIKL